MSDIKRLGLSGSADYATAVKRYGGGGDNNRPELGRWCFIFNNSTTDIPLFEKTDAEMLAMYNNISSVSTVAFQTGQYAQYNNNNGTTTLNNNTAVMETVSGAPCWSPATPSQLFTAPPACPTNFQNDGVLYDKDSATNDEPGKTGIHHSTSDLGWMFYQYAGYICNSPFVANVNVRVCTWPVTGSNNAETDSGSTTSGI